MKPVWTDYTAKWPNYQRLFLSISLSVDGTDPRLSRAASGNGKFATWTKLKLRKIHHLTYQQTDLCLPRCLTAYSPGLHFKISVLSLPIFAHNICPSSLRRLFSEPRTVVTLKGKFVENPLSQNLASWAEVVTAPWSSNASNQHPFVSRLPIYSLSLRAGSRWLEHWLEHERSIVPSMQAIKSGLAE